MSVSTEALRWYALQLLKPYLHNQYLDKGKWFLLDKLNPKPGDSLAKHGTKLVRTRYGSRLYGDMQCTSHRFMYFSGEYEVPVSRLIAQVLRPGWRFVDVGANIGFYTLLAAKLADQVISVEPNPFTRELLMKNLRLNDVQNVTIVPYGFSDSSGQFTLHQTGTDIGGATLREPEASSANYQIEVVPGDAIISVDPSRRTFLKIDVEGWEYRVAKGFASLLQQCDVVVVLEVTDSWLRQTEASAQLLFELMSSLRFCAFEIYWPSTKIKTVPGLRKLTEPLAAFQYDVLFARWGSKQAFWKWVQGG